MQDLDKSMKLSLILGFIGAVLMPLIYECYANVSRGLALFFCACWLIFCGIRFAPLPFKAAFLGISCAIAYMGALGMVCFLIIHPRIMDMLLERSVYFQLTLRDQALFILYVFLLSVGMYLIWLIRAGLIKARDKLRHNRELTGKYIENAFEDGDDQ